MADGDRASSWLKRALLGSLCVLVLLLCASMCVGLSILMDVRQEVKTLQGETERVLSLLDRMGTFATGKLSESLPLGCAAKDNPVAQQEIGHLLTCIGQSKLRYEYGGERHDASWVQAKLCGKTVVMCTEVACAEDFIEKVAAHTHEGYPYYVIERGGTRTELRTWLYQRLEERRKPPAAANP